MKELTKTESFSRFGKSFQENICQLMLEDRPFFDQITEVLDINFFEKKYLQIFAKTLINYRDKYNTHPNSHIRRRRTNSIYKRQVNRLLPKAIIENSHVEVC